MTRNILVVTGTDTGIGKTVVAAGLAGALGADYWKPIQAGDLDGTDSASVAALGGLPPERILPEAYRLTLAASPHLAAEAEGLVIDPARLALPASSSGRPLVVEGAGGLMVPVRREPPFLYIQQFACWKAPVVLVARTSLGTINHSLLSLAALRDHDVTYVGVVFVGDAHADNEKMVTELGQARHLGRIPRLDPLDAGTLAGAIRDHVDLAAIRAAIA